MRETQEPLPPAGSPRLSTQRRTIIRGAAWSVPIIAAATAAPAHAQNSTDPEPPPAQSARFELDQSFPLGTWVGFDVVGRAINDAGYGVNATLRGTVIVTVTPPPGVTIDGVNLYPNGVSSYEINPATGIATITYTDLTNVNPTSVGGSIRFGGTLTNPDNAQVQFAGTASELARPVFSATTDLYAA